MQAPPYNFFASPCSERRKPAQTLLNSVSSKRNTGAPRRRFHTIPTDVCTLFLPCFGLCQPAAPQLLRGNAAQIGLNVQDRRAIQHVDSANVQVAALAAEQLKDSQANRIRPPRRPCREDPVRPVIRGRRTGQLEAAGAVELPEHEQMREALDISKPWLIFRKDLEHTLGCMLRTQSLGNCAGFVVRAADKSNWPGRKHREEFLHFFG